MWGGVVHIAACSLHSENTGAINEACVLKESISVIGILQDFGFDCCHKKLTNAFVISAQCWKPEKDDNKEA